MTRELELQALLLRGLAGDAVAYREFLAALALHVRGFLRRRLAARPSEVEDLLQEVLLAVHNARHTYQAQQPLTAWVQAIARYKLADYLRGYGRREARHAPLEDDDELLACSDEAQSDASRDLLKLLEYLPPRQRLPIVHVKLEGLSVEQAARITGLSSSAVKVGIHRGLRALAKLIQRRNDDEDR
ncbi:RNA polymerase sigma factor CarQ [Pseudomonas reidholzensis]|uniref:RNA polymerase sigma factor CarQ n=2 Tax=Pseudomonas reidholzensis TaxID=1785162 RepID=A0A383RU39_9PSED|nr:RNA polymerase sigma factor CarQ [Pseudomonas reidholzensis]